MSGGIERRRSNRKQVIETFQVFLVIPKSGLRRLYLKDVSDHGLGFAAEPDDRFASGDITECFFYINPSLKLPLKIKVAHVQSDQNGELRVGCELLDDKSKAATAFRHFINLLDELSAFLDS